MTPSSSFYISQRLRLHYADWGNDAAPPLILLHGGLDHCRSWDWIATELRGAYHVVAPDLRGHGDSAWSPDGSYSLAVHVYDLAALIQQQGLAPVRIVAHSLGGHIALRYAGIHPENVTKIVAIEGLGPPPAMAAAQAAKPIEQRMREWIEKQHALAGRHPRRYASVEDAMARMQAANPRLDAARVEHLTRHALRPNEAGGFSWKYDNASRPASPSDLTADEMHRLWSRIECPVLLVNGRDSWAADPVEDGSLAHFRDAGVAMFEDAGHWVHHDRFADVLGEVRRFLA